MNYSVAIPREIWARQENGLVWLAERQYTGATEGSSVLWSEIGPLSQEVATRRLEYTTSKFSATDIFFAPQTFSVESTARHNDQVTLSSSALFADLDDAPPIPDWLTPSFLWSTSPRMRQAVWLLDKSIKIADFRDLNQRLTYYLGADKGGWTQNKLLRVPGTLNWKRHSFRDGGLFVPRGEVIHASSDYYDSDMLQERIPTAGTLLAGTAVTDSSFAPVHPTIEMSEIAAHKILYKCGGVDNLYLRALLEANFSPVKDRSRVMWRVASTCAELGVDKRDTYYAMYYRPWNKFANRPQKLWEDIKRAYAYVDRA